jgi:hypothetical protein
MEPPCFQLWKLLCFLVSLTYFLPTRCRCYCCTWSHSVTHTHTHTHAHTHSVALLSTSGRPVAVTSPWKHTTLKRDEHPYSRRDSNLQSQQASGHRPTPETTRPPGKPIAWPLPAQPVARGQCIACGDSWNETASSNRLPAKAHLTRRKSFGNLWAVCLIL